MIPPFSPSVRRLKRIAPLQLGKMLVCLYGLMGPLAVPVFLLLSMATANLPAQQRGVFAMVSVGFAIAAPFLYAAIGFIAGLIGAALYNLLAKWIGGIEVEVE